MSETRMIHEEEKQLRLILNVIEREIQRLQEETGLHEDAVNDVQIQVKGITDETIAMQIFLSRAAVLKALWKARHQAYFAHLQFAPKGSEPEDFYIGRWGVYDSVNLQQKVVDWRAPLANLYYCGDMGPVHYVAPDGVIEGNLLLKRILSIRDQQVLHAYDTGIVGQESWLEQALQTNAGARLHEIVTSIQKEQNLIIRVPLTDHLIVQGVAGSGKTSIALHRIAYLLYRYRDEMKPENILILAPNPLFLSYISQVLPELGVEHVRQTTFHELARSWFGNALPYLIGSSSEECPPDPAVLSSRRMKTSLQCKEMLESFLKQEEKEMLPKADICFGRYILIDKTEMEEIFLSKMSSWPLAQRIMEVQKIASRRLEKLTDRMKQTMENMAKQKLEQILSSMPDGEERRRRAGKLLDSRDSRVREIDDRAKDFLKNFPKLFSDMSLSAVYRRFLASCFSEDIRSRTNELLDKGRIEEADLPAMIAIGRAVLGIPHEKIKHVVIDESQDMSSFAVRLLSEAFPGASMTLVGDLMQGIHADSGTADYEEWIQPVFGGKVQYRTLQVSYRSTLEISEMAQKVAGHAKHKLIQTYAVQRHGEVPERICYSSEQEQLKIIRETVNRWKEQKMDSIAVIANTKKEAEQLYRKARLSDSILLEETMTAYSGGTVVMAARECKGMEFDGVILCDASSENYPEEEWYVHMMYVLVTRPLHKLLILANKKMSPLLEEQEKSMVSIEKEACI
ncbi:MAG: AAA family ATPase [Clostridia bacterium]|nr:AAA family ATPase [Clostridia bacterium]